MGLVNIITNNSKNIIPEFTTFLGNMGFTKIGVNVSTGFALGEAGSSVLIPFMKSTGALAGKVIGYGVCHKDLMEEDYDEFKSKLKTITNIMIPYQVFNCFANSFALYIAQNNYNLDSSDLTATIGLTIGVDTVCVIGRYFVEHKLGIYK